MRAAGGRSGATCRLLVLRLLDPRELGDLKKGWSETEVGQVIRQTKRDLPRLSDAIAVSYFAHSAISRAGGGTAA